MVLLLPLALGALPTGRHSRDGGYPPSGGLGGVTLLLVVLLLMQVIGARSGLRGFLDLRPGLFDASFEEFRFYFGFLSREESHIGFEGAIAGQFDFDVVASRVEQ